MATYWENSCSFGLRYVSWYKYLIVSLVFSHLGFWSGNLFLIAPFPDLCLLVPFFEAHQIIYSAQEKYYENDRKYTLPYKKNKVRVPSSAVNLSSPSADFRELATLWDLQ